MLLVVESDASYLSVVKARTCATRIFQLTNIPAAPTTNLTLNGAVHVLCHIMRKVLSCAAEAELGARALTPSHHHRKGKKYVYMPFYCWIRNQICQRSI